MFLNAIQDANGYTGDVLENYFCSEEYFNGFSYGLLFDCVEIFLFQGALQNFVLSLQTELVSGDVLRDALELGAADLQGIFQVAKELIVRYYRSSATGNSSEL
jgi:hypothetical protein